MSNRVLLVLTFCAFVFVLCVMTYNSAMVAAEHTVLVH